MVTLLKLHSQSLDDLREILDEMGRSARDCRMALSSMEGLGLDATPYLVETAHRMIVSWSILDEWMSQYLRNRGGVS